jgi:hypothetical protein
MKTVPPIGTKGIYTLKAPFTTQPNELYRCGAIRSFKDIENFGQNVFKLYYEPFGISQSVYNTDLQNGEVIVALLSDKYPPIYVPSSHITSFPNLGSKTYHHVVLAASLGPIYEAVDLTYLKQQVAAVISDTIGLVPKVELAIAPMTGVVTPEEHEATEVARQAAITNRVTDRARLIQSERQKTALEQRVLMLEAIVRDNGLLG